jgi:uncharacterized repeat protein (TIGR03806 family)
MRPKASLVAACSIALAGVLGACGDDDPFADRQPQVPPAGNPLVDGSVDGSDVPDASLDGGPVRADFGLDVRPSNPTCRAPARPVAPGPVTLQEELPSVSLIGPMVTIVQIPGDGSRWFGALLDGRIVSFPSVNPAVQTAPAVVADIGTLSGMPVDTDGEGGLLGLAFHPKFAQNGQLFVSWTTTGPGASGMRSVVSRITSTDGGKTFGQYVTILGPFEQPATNHNGGGARFGPDGFLYLSFGDGGGGGDPFDNGQTKDGFFSKILRIDVDAVPAGQTYGIPDGNPFKNGGGEPATFARGLRNPFRFSFDRASGDLWVGDVGQNAWEEIDVVKVGGNYGWPCREGAHDYRPEVCGPGSTLAEPVYEYEHTGTYTAITGGFVYRGSAIPGFTGSYVFGRFPGNAYALTFDPATGAPSATMIGDMNQGWVDFAEDVDGEIHGLVFGGPMVKVVAAQPSPPTTFPDRLSKTGCVDPADPRKPAAGVVPYEVNAPFWSDGADKERFMALPDGMTITVGPDGDFGFPPGSVLMKTFTLAGKRIETRLFVRHDDGGWAGYDYEWNDAQTDAVLLPSSKSKKIGAQTWRFPSRAECAGCHTLAAGSTLGLELGQLNGDLVYAKTNRISNQLSTLEHIGMLAAPLGKPASQLVAYPTPGAAGPVEPRARAYLHGNCSHCHRPSGPGRGNLDLRFGTALAATNACGTAPQLGDLGVAGAKVIAPGSPAQSVLSLRPHALGASRMPPIASNVVDAAGLGVVDDWIRGLNACP